MKIKQKPNAAGAAAVGVSAAGGANRLATVKQRSKVEEAVKQRSRQTSATSTATQCERERKHEAARKEREAQAQLKRTSTATQAARARTKPIRRSASATKEEAKDNAANATATSSGSNDEEAAQLRLQLEHLAQLSQQDFEREFRKWMAQEGIEGKVQAQVRMDLINSFNGTSLGKLLRKASTSAAASSGGMQRTAALPKTPAAQECLLLTLQTLVAEFLYAHNLHYTLSVYCSELPKRDALPDFESRDTFRFSQQELQQLLGVVVSELQLQSLLRLYDEEQVSLLLVCFKLLANQQQPRHGIEMATNTTDQQCSTATTQTQPTACLPSLPDVNTSKLFRASELVVADDGRSVFMGPRVSQSLSGVEQQLGQLMLQMGSLCKSCAPPVEIISQSAFEQLLQQELLERQRLLNAGQTLAPGQTALQLPERHKATAPQQLEQDDNAGNTVQSPAGPIQLPAETASVPNLPQLHAEQLASLAMVQQALQQLQQQMQQPQHCLHLTLDRMEALVGELAGCIQTLSNVLNLAMEQEYAVGRHKGFKLGYREGFAHGHFMGIQEGMQSAEQQQQQQEKLKQVEQQQQASQRQLKESSSQTPQSPAPVKVSRRSVSCQTPHKRQRHRMTSTDRRLEALTRHVASQTVQDQPVSRSYEQWIYEMLHSSSGQIFLDRVELSLNKALELQKKRLDELFNVKLRHHAELMRLSNRQSSWRTLCRHVERDSQSLEARDLVHKIFHLLEHYEAHHRLLAEKIQQTEKAAEQAAHIEPIWKDASDSVTTCNVTSASSASRSAPIAAEAALFAPKTIPLGTTLYSAAPTAFPPAASNAHQLEHIPDVFAATLPAAEATEALRGPTATLSTAESIQFLGPASTAATINVPTSLPAPVHASLPGFVPSQLPAPLASQLHVLPPPSTAASAPASILPSAMTMPTLFTHLLLPLAAPATDASTTSAAAVVTETASRPLMHNVATNTQRVANLSPAVERPQPAPSFNEALLSAKNRMLQLEQESDLLEQSFLGYLERARAQKQKDNISASCALEQQQFHRTLDNFREWQQRMRSEEAAATPSPTAIAAPVVISPIYSGSELEPDSYQFTNAIAVARHKLLSELQATTPLSSAGEIVSSTNKLLVDQVQDETQQLLSRVEATLARVSKPSSFQLLTAESQQGQVPLDLEALSSSAHSSLEEIAANVGGKTTLPASSKLQRSMAKMQLLFGNQTEQPTTTAKRPWSAPIAQLNGSQLAAPTRPHTAPSSLTDAPLAQAGGQFLGVLDAFSDVGSSTGKTSSLSSSLGHHSSRKSPLLMGAADLIYGDSSGTGSHASSTPVALSPSQEFWRRINM